MRFSMRRMHHTLALLVVLVAMVRALPSQTAARISAWAQEATGNRNAVVLAEAACQAVGMP